MTEAQRPRGSKEPLHTAYDVALLDLDGVVYLGGTAIPGAAEALRKADRGRHAAGVRDQQRLPHPGRHRRPADELRRAGLAGRRGDLRPGRRPAAGRTPSGGRAGPGHRRQRPADGGARARPAPGQHRGRAAARGGPGLFARRQLLDAGRGRPRGGRRRAVRGVQRRPHPAQPARTPAGQRVADPGGRDRDRGAAAGGGQARAPAAPRIGAADRRQASARRRRPAGHRHRGRPPGRGRTACSC